MPAASRAARRDGPPGRRAGATKAGRRGGPACGDPRIAGSGRSAGRRPRAAPDADRADRAPRHPVRRPPRGYPGAGGRGPAVPHRAPPHPAPRSPAAGGGQRSRSAHSGRSPLTGAGGPTASRVVSPLGFSHRDAGRKLAATPGFYWGDPRDHVSNFPRRFRASRVFAV